MKRIRKGSRCQIRRIPAESVVSIQGMGRHPSRIQYKLNAEFLVSTVVLPGGEVIGSGSAKRIKNPKAVARVLRLGR